jgi:hypothetical protein
MLAAIKSSLQEALLFAVDPRLRGKARRFLAGLSLDELESIASFSGACVLEGRAVQTCTREHLAEWVRQFGLQARKSDGLMLLLFEYFCRYGAAHRH